MIGRSRMRAALGILAAAALAGGCGGAASTGYAVTAPAGWTDRTTFVESHSGSDFEAVYEGPRDGTVTASIAIVRVEAPEGATLEQMGRLGQRNVARAYDMRGTATRPVDATLDGARALQLDYEVDGGGVRQVVAMRGANVYLVSFTAGEQAYQRRLETFEAMLRSWRWEEE
jgi:hypothetical protein